MCSNAGGRRWPFRTPLLVLCVFSATIQAYRISKREIVDDSVQRYLTTFGYMSRTKDGAFALRTEESVRSAIREMQEFAGIPVTGRLDAPTIKLLRTPRCGMPDKVLQTSGRRKRFTLHGQKWPKHDLTWSLRNYYLPNMNMHDVRYVLSKALEVWSRHSNLTFTEVNSDRADIRVYFYSGDHNDSFPFDGKGVILAHAFFPNGGRSIDVHFDADETWSTSPDNNDEGTNLFNVAAHEFGHSLGLSHSSVEGALMYPWYKEMENGFNYELPDDDKIAIQTLYGYRTRTWDRNPYRYHTAMTTTTTTPTPPTQRSTPRRQWPYDPRYPNGRHPHKPHYNPHKPMHPDKKPHYYPKIPHYHPSHRNYPWRTTTIAPTFAPATPPPDKTPVRGPHRHYSDKESSGRKPPDTCDTSYDAIAVIRREVFIFKDAYFWRIGETGGLLPGYPAEITRMWRSLPHNLTGIDAVYERPDNKIVMFINNLFYVFTGNRLEHGYPRPLTDLGLPADLKKIDGAMVWGHNGKTYFYSGSSYWKFDEDTMNVELDYPRNIAMWKGVGTDIDAVFQWKDGRTYFFKGKGFWKFNDLYMRVEHEQQKPSAPFWMGCTNNLESTSEDSKKLPYQHHPNLSAASASLSTLHSLLILLPLIIHKFGQYASLSFWSSSSSSSLF